MSAGRQNTGSLVSHGADEFPHCSRYWYFLFECDHLFDLDCVCLCFIDNLDELALVKFIELIPLWFV